MEEKEEDEYEIAKSFDSRPEDLKFIVRDTANNRFYDIRDKYMTTLINQEVGKLTRISNNLHGNTWKDWWQKKKDLNIKLLRAAESGDMMLIIDLLNKTKHNDLTPDINTKGLDGFTPLHFAASEGHIETVMTLVKKGANVAATSVSLRTPLHVACIRGYTEIILILIQNKANLNDQDKDGNTSIHLLSEGGWAEALKICLNYKPDLTIKNVYSETPIEVASSVEVIKLLNEQVKDVDERYGRTVVNNVLVRNNRADVIKQMFFKGQRLAGIEEQKSQESTMKVDKKKRKNAKVIKIMQIVKELKAINPEETTRTSTSEVSIEHFKIIKLLGTGSFGEVYLVQHRSTSNYYAMKVLDKLKFKRQNLLKYAKTERNVLCYTKSPFIVSLEFAFQTAKKLILILEYCPMYFLIITIGEI